MTNIPFDDQTFDIVLTSHVLEHIPNDIKAMNELSRILKTGGYSIHQVPIDYSLAKTFEDSSINTEYLRKKYYGHIDHKRLYGKDYLDRLISAGLKVKILDYVKTLPGDIINRYGLNPNELFYYCFK
jgi:ubiquinone/menaquinone biosynthesis C-methylase UbiE